jgi:hypothetical protein
MAVTGKSIVRVLQNNRHHGLLLIGWSNNAARGNLEQAA